ATELARLQRRDQRRLVDDRAARDVDEGPLGAERLNDGAAHQVAGRLAAGTGDCEDLAPFGESDRVGEIAIRHLGFTARPLIGDLHAEGGGAARDRAADPPEADDAELAP